MNKAMKVALMFILIPCMPLAYAESLNGVWQSNEEMTINFMNTVPDIAEKKRVFLSKKFFGKEKYEFTDNVLTRESLIDGEVYRLSFNYLILPKGDRSFEIVYLDDVSDLEASETIYFEKKCFYVMFDSQGLREYFCRLEQSN